MMQSIFVTDFNDETGQPVLPDRQDAGDGLGLWPDDTAGYGFLTLSYTPTEGTCVVLVSSSAAVIDAMKVDDGFLWVEDIE